MTTVSGHTELEIGQPTFGIFVIGGNKAMKQKEFEALLKIQDRYLLMCNVIRNKGLETERLFAADVITRGHRMVMDGIPAKTRAAAVQKSIARYYKQNANHK